MNTLRLPRKKGTSNYSVKIGRKAQRQTRDIHESLSPATNALAVLICSRGFTRAVIHFHSPIWGISLQFLSIYEFVFVVVGICALPWWGVANALS